MLHVPALKTTLISAGAMPRHDVSMETTTDGWCKIKHGADIILWAERTGTNLYKVRGPRKTPQGELNGATATLLEEEKWHARKGHLGRMGMCRLLKENLVRDFRDIDVGNFEGICDACMWGKSTRQPIPRNTQQCEQDVLATKGPQ